MILARERFDYFEQPLQVGRGRKTKKIMRFKLRTRVLYTGIILLAFFMGLGLTWRYAQVTATGYEIVRMKKELKAMELENQQLLMKMENLQSLERIESVAVNKLGMVKPDPEAGVQFVAIESIKTGVSKPAVVDRTDSPSRSVGNVDSLNIIRAFTNLVAGWTGKETAAEAKPLNR